MKQIEAIIIQKTTEITEIFIEKMNGHEISQSNQSRYEHHYELKMKSNDEDLQYEEWDKWLEFVHKNNGEYDFNLDTNKNEGTIPEIGDCWCSAMSIFLLENGYELRKDNGVTSKEEMVGVEYAKRDIYVKIIK